MFLMSGLYWVVGMLFLLGGNPAIAIVWFVGSALWGLAGATSDGY